jgi:hypothetical protein
MYDTLWQCYLYTLCSICTAAVLLRSFTTYMQMDFCEGFVMSTTATTTAAAFYEGS